MRRERGDATGRFYSLLFAQHDITQHPGNIGDKNGELSARARQHNDDNALKLKTRTNRLEQYLYDYIPFLVYNEEKKTCILSD